MQEYDCCVRVLGPKSNKKKQTEMINERIRAVKRKDSKRTTDSFSDDDEKSSVRSTLSRHSPEHGSVAELSLRSPSAPQVGDTEDEDEELEGPRCAIASIEVSPTGLFFAVVMQDGRVLLYLLPKIMGISNFEIFFSLLAPTLDTLKESLFEHAADKEGTMKGLSGLLDNPALQSSTSARINSLFKGLGGTLKKAFFSSDAERPDSI